MRRSKKKVDKYDVVFVFLLIIGLVFLCWKAKYGSADKDESFYITISYRMWQGDALYFDEMHIAQTFAFLTYPIMHLYMLLFKSTQGIVLFYRYVYIIAQIITSVFLYIRFRDISKTGAIVASFVFLMFAPFNEMALYYNTIGIVSLTVSLTLLLTHKKKTELIIAGVFFAGSVLCNPYNAITYFVYSILVLSFHIAKKQKEPVDKESWFYITLGIIILAACFILFVFSKIEVKTFMKNLPYLVRDENHEFRTFFEIMKTYLIYSFAFTNYTLYLYLVLLVIFIISSFDKNKTKNRYLYFISYMLNGMMLLLFVYLADNNVNYIMFPLNTVGLLCGTLSERKDTKRIMFLYSAPAFMYTIYVHATSNVGSGAICSSSVVCLVSCIVIVCCVFEEIIKKDNHKRIMSSMISFAFVALMVFQTGTEVYLRYTSCFPDPLYMQDTIIESGPCKGIIEEGREKDAYDKTLDLLEHIRNNYPERKVLFLCHPTWIYLAAEEYSNCSTSSWNSMHQSKYNYVSNYYYSVNSEKIPEIIIAGYDMYDPAIDDLEIISMFELVEEYENNKIYLRK